MKPIPIVFHIGPLQIHTYGIGLAITFWFAFRYFERRLKNAGYEWQWLSGAFLWIIGSAIVGARVVHLVANAHFYLNNPGQILAVWNGGLSSFGGLLFAVPTGLYFAHKHCPRLGVLAGLDLVTPVLLAAWSVGRLLGPQLMINGGGHPTSAWYGLSYAGQVGKRIPVPLFQSFECLVIFSVVIWIERRIRGRGLPVGFVLAAGITLWDISRFADEFFWLAVPRLWDAVEVASVVFAVIGLAAMAIMWTRSQSGRATTGPAPAGSMAAGSMAVGSMTAGSIGAESGAGPGPGAGLGRPSVLSAALPGEPGSGTGLVPGDRQTPGL